MIGDLVGRAFDAAESLGWLGGGFPASYGAGARVPQHIPVPEMPRAPSLVSLMDGLGPALTMENVEQLLEDMVRPALNADGGDITLVKIERGDVYVLLVGSCSSCPSSVMTMKMGVERLLQDEFPEMGELIQVDQDLA